MAVIDGVEMYAMAHLQKGQKIVGGGQLHFMDAYYHVLRLKQLNLSSWLELETEIRLTTDPLFYKIYDEYSPVN